MNFAGIDIASETHVLAVVSADGAIQVRATPFAEDAQGYALLLERLGPPDDIAVAMEATGHYWKNLFAALCARGYAVALLNPLRTRRFADEDLQRTKTDAIDALGIARFSAQKRPAITRLTDAATQELRELVRLRDRVMAEIGDRVRQLHRLVDLGFPEFTRFVRTLDSQLAVALLRQSPTAQAFVRVGPTRISKLVYDGRHRVGPELARQLVDAARISVGAHHGPAYRVQIKYLCEDLETLRSRLRELDADLELHLDDHQVGTLLTSIDGIGKLTAARLIAELGDPAKFASASALAAFVGVIPALRDSGKRRSRAFLTSVGHRSLRHALWMPTLTAVRRNPWLRAYYQRLRSNGKPAKVALIAAMRKLLIAVYAVARDRQPFVPHLPHEAQP